MGEGKKEKPVDKKRLDHELVGGSFGEGKELRPTTRMEPYCSPMGKITVKKVDQKEEAFMMISVLTVAMKVFPSHLAFSEAAVASCRYSNLARSIASLLIVLIALKMFNLM